MSDLVIDTAALIAFANVRDSHHGRARDFLKGLPTGQVFHLSNYISDEMLTRLRARAGHDVTMGMVQYLNSSRLHLTHQITEDLQEEALEIFSGQGNLGLSFTDCTTVALMRRLEITDIFTFDRAFAALGFTVHP